MDIGARNYLVTFGKGPSWIYNIGVRSLGWNSTSPGTHFWTGMCLWDCVWNFVIPSSLPQFYLALWPLLWLQSTWKTRSGEKPCATFNRRMGTTGGQWLACIDAKKNGICTAPWTGGLLVGRFRFAAKIASAMNSWASVTSEWYPHQKWHVNYYLKRRRRIGGPAQRWDDQMEIFHSSWFQTANNETWSSHETIFVQWCLERWCLAVVSHVPRGP